MRFTWPTSGWAPRCGYAAHRDLPLRQPTRSPALAGRLRDSATQWRRESLIADASPPAASQVTLEFSFGNLRDAAGLADEPGQAPDDIPGQRSGDVDRRTWGAT